MFRYDPFMRWLFHGNLTPAAAEAIKRHKQETQSPADIGLPPDALPVDLLEAARKGQLEIITADAALAHAAVRTALAVCPHDGASQCR